MRTWIMALSTAAVVACGGGAATETKVAAEPFPNIALEELRPLVEAKKVVLVDANGTDSFNEGHIPGAIDFAAHGGDLAAVLPADKSALVVAYCGGPQCSAWEEGAKAVAALGYKQVKHFGAGISGWEKGAAPIERVQ